MLNQKILNSLLIALTPTLDCTATVLQFQEVVMFILPGNNWYFHWSYESP